MQEEKRQMKIRSIGACAPVTKVSPKVIDQTNLQDTAKEEDIKKGALQAKELDFRSFVTYECYTSLVRPLLLHSNVLTVSVCDFPKGRSDTINRITQIKHQLELGAEEVDIVASYHFLLEGNERYFKTDIREITEAISGKPLKIILEVDYLTEEQIREATRIICEVVKERNRKNIIIKTKTGFAKTETPMPNLKAVKIIKEELERQGMYAKDIVEIKTGKIGIKASGSIKTKEDAIALLEAGAHILGTSSGVQIVSSF